MAFKSFVRSVAVASGLSVATAGSALPLISLPANAYAQQVQNPTGGNMGGRVALSQGDQFADEYQRIVGRINGRREISYNDVITFLNGVLEKVHSNRDLNDNELSALSRLRNPRNLDNNQKMTLRLLLVEVRNGISGDHPSEGVHLLLLRDRLVTPVRVAPGQSGAGTRIRLDTDIPTFPFENMSRRAVYAVVGRQAQLVCDPNVSFSDHEYYLGRGAQADEFGRQVATAFHAQGCENVDTRSLGRSLVDFLRQGESSGVLEADLARTGHSKDDFYTALREQRFDDARAMLPDGSPLKDYIFNIQNHSTVVDMVRRTAHIEIGRLRVGMNLSHSLQDIQRWSAAGRNREQREEYEPVGLVVHNLHLLWEYARMPYTQETRAGSPGMEQPVAGTRIRRRPSLLGERGTLGLGMGAAYLGEGQYGMDIQTRVDQREALLWVAPMVRSGTDTPITGGIPLGSRARRPFFTLDVGGGLSTEAFGEQEQSIVPRKLLGLHALLGIRGEGRQFQVSLQALSDTELRSFMQGERSRSEVEEHFELRLNPRYTVSRGRESVFTLYALGKYSYDTLLRQLAGEGAGHEYGGEAGLGVTYHGVVNPLQVGLEYARWSQGTRRPLPVYSIGVNLRANFQFEGL